MKARARMMPPLLLMRPSMRLHQPCDKRAQRKTARIAPRRVSFPKARLALGELEAAASLGPAILLAFHSARVAGEKAARLENGAQGGLVFHQGARNAVTHRAGLARQAAAIDSDDHVELAVA